MKTKTIRCCVVRLTLLLFAFGGMLGGISVWGQTGDFTFSANGDTVIAYNGAGGEVTVPDVKAIGSQVFIMNQTLTGVTIPASVEVIGGAAFGVCMSLSRVTFAEGSKLRRIDDLAFSMCTALTGITLPSGLTEIGQSAFNATGLTSIVIPNGVQVIPYMAFYYCRALRTVTLGSGVDSIGAEAFLGIPGLGEMHVQAIVPPWLGNKAFGNEENEYDSVPTSCLVYVPAGSPAAYRAADGWKEFTNIVEEGWTTPIEEFTLSADGETLIKYNGSAGVVVVPQGVKVIGSKAFLGNTTLTSVGFPGGVDGVRSIGDSVFYECTSLSNVTLPNSVTTLGKAAFAYCLSLNTVVIGEGMSRLEDAFYNCTNLQTLVIGSNMDTIYQMPFSDSYSPLLQNLVMRCVNPPIIDRKSALPTSLPSVRRLYVPQGTLEAYRDVDTNDYVQWATQIIADVPLAQITVYSDSLIRRDTTRVNDTARVYIHDTIRYQHVNDTTIYLYIHDTFYLDTTWRDTTYEHHIPVTRRDTTRIDTLFLHDTLYRDTVCDTVRDVLTLPNLIYKVDTLRLFDDTVYVDVYAPRIDTVRHTLDILSKGQLTLYDTTRVRVYLYETHHDTVVFVDSTLPPPTLSFTDTFFLPYENEIAHYLILDPTDGTGLSVAPSVGVRASAAEGGIMLEGLTAGEGFAVYSVEGLLLVRGVAGADGRCLLRDLAGGTYLLGHGGRWGRFVHN